MDEALVDGFEEFRAAAGGYPVVISNGGGCRCAAYNATLRNSAPDSQHILGKALDCNVMIPDEHRPGMRVRLAPTTARAFAEAVPVFARGGIGVYARHIHLDTGRKRRWKGTYR